MTSYDLIESRKRKNQVFNILNVERSKFSKHVMVSAGVCVTVERACCTSSQIAKVNAKLYVETLLLRWIGGASACKHRLGSVLVFPDFLSSEGLFRSICASVDSLLYLNSDFRYFMLLLRL